MKGIGNCGILLFLLFFVNSALTQQIGLSGGASVDPITSLRLAAFYEHELEPWLSIQPEISYLQKGHSSLVDRLFEEPPGLRYGALDAFSSSVFAKFRLKRPNFSFYILAGPSLSRFTGAIAVFAGEDEIYQRVRLPLSSYEVKAWDWGGTIGLGLEKDIRKKQKIFVDVRYYQGFENLNQSSERVFYLEALYFDFGLIIPLTRRDKKKSQAR
ncbi:MAG: PorT family protein [Saprospiraceae bacterium]|nr:PorT family protein [Saprospiraceae bacterium]